MKSHFAPWDQQNVTAELRTGDWVFPVLHQPSALRTKRRVSWHPSVGLLDRRAVRRGCCFIFICLSKFQIGNVGKCGM